MRMHILELKETDWNHLRDIMQGETDGTDPVCIGCAAILRALGIDPASVERKPSAEQGLGRLGLTPDDAERIGIIAGGMELAPKELRRFFDQDGRDARYLRLLQKRIRAAFPLEDGRG